MNTTTSSAVPNPQAEKARPRRGRRILRGIGRGLKWLGIGLVALVLLGVTYQTIATEIDRRNYSPRGQLYTINGHQMHIVCKGQGSPTVILQAGGAAESLWWYRVQNQMAEHTRVCAYDRPGMGWSEPTTQPRDALTLVGELHTLLKEAGVPGPYVMAGHSWGAVLTRVYAAQYPQEIAGIALVDSAILLPKHFANQSEFEAWKSSFAGLNVIFGAMTRLGLPRLTDPSVFQNASYPPNIALELVSLRSRNEVVDTNFVEFHAEMWALTEASATAENLDDLPMAVMWASEGWASTDAQIGNAPAARAEIATYSSNSVPRLIEGADHLSILGNEQYAQEVTDAILDVIEAAETGEPMAQ